MHMYDIYIYIYIYIYICDYVSVEKDPEGTHEEVHIGYWRSVEHEGGRKSLKAEAKRQRDASKEA